MDKVWVAYRESAFIGVFHELDDALGACFDDEVEEGAGFIRRLTLTLPREQLRAEFISGAWNDNHADKLGYWEVDYEGNYTAFILGLPFTIELHEVQ